MSVYEYRCPECPGSYERKYLEGEEIPPSIPCEVCGGLANKITVLDIKIKTSEVKDMKLLGSQLREDSYANVARV